MSLADYSRVSLIKHKVISTGGRINEIFRDKVKEWIENIVLEVHNNPHAIKYFKDKMIQSISSRDESLSSCNPSTMKYLEGQLRAEILCAYKLNYAAVRNKHLKNINTKNSYPLPPFAPSKPPKPKSTTIFIDSLKVSF